jgi:hypothetical protein
MKNTTKDIIRQIFITIICLLIFTLVTGAIEYHRSHITIKGVVSEYDQEDEVLTIKSEDGNLWMYITDEHYVPGQKVIIHMNNEGTETLIDDTIEEIEKTTKK